MSTTIEKGIIASPGIQIGKAYVLKGDKIIIPKYRINEDEVEAELERFSRALKQTREEIAGIQQQIANGISKEVSDIFASHLMVLEDPLITEKSVKTVKEEKRNIEWVINDISVDLINSLKTIEDEYIRERIVDISDISKRLISNLQKTEKVSLSDINEKIIVFAQDLTPSETAIMNKNQILAFVTDQGGRTSHTAIMARALEIPAIIGTINTTSLVKTGDTVIVDAINGKIIIDPDANDIKQYKRYKSEFQKFEKELLKLQDLSAQTLDGQDVTIHGNIEIPEEMKMIKEHGVHGIGLFRSEFLFLGKSLPEEETQLLEYRRVIEYFSPMPVTIRTIDVGGDKVYAFNPPYKERNPFLGCRAIRFSLENTDLFKIQLRAILRSSHYGKVKLMFPMITTIDELKKALAITEEVKDELRSESIPFDENIPVGIMIEVPSAVILADRMAPYVDFFSVGTNDLVQYLLAVDRISEKVAYLYNPLNLAVLRMLKKIVDVSKEHSVSLSICGEIAGEPQYTMTLLGLGFRTFSMSTTYMYQVKKIIRSVTIEECMDLAETLLKMEDTEKIEETVRQTFKYKFEENLL